MTLGTMKIWRLFVPAALIIIYGMILAYIVAGVRWEIPDLSNAPYLIILLIPAVLYYITPIRGWINQASHTRITENLRAGMVEIAGYDDDPQKYSWPNLRSLFFKLVDEDKSLSTKASLAYFNGLIWTGLADSAAIALGYALVSVGLFYFDAPNALTALAVFVAIVILSLLGNRVARDRQMEIGNQQLEVMKFEHRAAIEKRLNLLD
uniref:Uncharacterized protein n=1 Tax=Chelativorans sp. (strain BNC1) TaxID=266779 RepID=Q11FT6_CHESB